MALLPTALILSIAGLAPLSPAPLASLITAPAILTALSDDQTLISIDFEGGSVADYIAAVRRAAPDTNVIMSPELANIAFFPTSLRGVTSHGALNLLQGHRQFDKDGAMTSAIQFEMRSHPDFGAAVFIIKADRRPTQSPSAPELVTRVFSLASLTEHMDTAVILAAVETATTIHGDDQHPAGLTLHEPTELLFVRAPMEQIRLIEAAIAQLQTTTRRTSDDRQGMERIQRLQAANFELTQTIDRMRLNQQALETENERLKAQIERMMTPRPAGPGTPAPERP